MYILYNALGGAMVLYPLQSSNHRSKLSAIGGAYLMNPSGITWLTWGTKRACAHYSLFKSPQSAPPTEAYSIDYWPCWCTLYIHRTELRLSLGLHQTVQKSPCLQYIQKKTIEENWERDTKCLPVLYTAFLTFFWPTVPKIFVVTVWMNKGRCGDSCSSGSFRMFAL